MKRNSTSVFVLIFLWQEVRLIVKSSDFNSNNYEIEQFDVRKKFKNENFGMHSVNRCISNLPDQ